MPREYLPYAVIETAFLFTDHRYLSLPPSAKLIYITLWCRAFNERRSTLPPHVASPSATARDTGIDRRTIRKYVQLLSDRGLTILHEDGSVTIPGVHEKGNIRWKDGPDRGQTFLPTNDTERGKTKAHTRQEGEREYEGEREGEREKDFSPQKKPKGIQYTLEFNSFWEAYPKGEGQGSKAQAFRNWKSLLKEGVEPAALLRCVDNYAESVRLKRTDPQYIFRPSNFLGRQRYFEEFLPDSYRKPQAKSPTGEEGIITQEFIDNESPEDREKRYREIREHNEWILSKRRGNG